jgi:hypothetical protein
LSSSTSAALSPKIDHGVRVTRLQTQRARHPIGHERTVGERRQLDPPHPAGKALRDARRDLPGQPGLAAASRARERHQPRFAEQPRAALEVVGPPHERTQLGRKITRHPQSAHRHTPRASRSICAHKSALDTDRELAAYGDDET